MQNSFKIALSNNQPMLGLWLALSNAYCAEVVAQAGYDWLLIDAEHAPNTIDSILAQLQALSSYKVEPVVRPASDDAVQIKRLLDIGARTLLIPMVQSAQQAAAVVAATRYPPVGIRGVGSALARVSRWNTVTNYLKHANDQVCVLIQVETQQGLDEIEAICAVDGVDGVFVGPADLAADMGHIGNPGHPDVQVAIHNAIRRISAQGKAPGILSSDIGLIKRYLSEGAIFTAVGSDVSILLRGASALIGNFRPIAGKQDKQPNSVY